MGIPLHRLTYPIVVPLMSDPCVQFSDEDRANFEREIEEHIQAKEEFAQQQRRRNLAVNKANVDAQQHAETNSAMREVVIKKQDVVSICVIPFSVYALCAVL